MAKDKSAYAASGVSIAAQDEALAQVKKLARSTFTPGVLSDLGLFGGLFPSIRAALQDFVRRAEGLR